MKIRPEIYHCCPRYSRQRQESVTVGINKHNSEDRTVTFIFPLPLTIPVQDGRAAGAEWWPSLQVALILPLLLLLVGRLVHHFDLMLQHGKATDRHSDGAKRAGHLHGFSKGNVPKGWSVRGESVYCRSTSCVLSQLVLSFCEYSILHANRPPVAYVGPRHVNPISTCVYSENIADHHHHHHHIANTG